jgi:porin
MAQELPNLDLIVIDGGRARAGTNTGTVPGKNMRKTALALSGMSLRKLRGVDLSLRREATVADFLTPERNVKAGLNELLKQRMQAWNTHVVRGHVFALFRSVSKLIKLDCPGDLAPALQGAICGKKSTLCRWGVRLGCCAIVCATLTMPVLAQTEPVGLERADSCTCDSDPQRSAPKPDCEDGEDFRENYLFGDWLGVRCKLAARGIKPTLFLITDPMGNPFGGRRQGITDYNLIGLDLILDTGKLIGWPGGQFHVGFANSAGTDLSAKYVGNSFPIQNATAAAPAGSRLTYLSYTQAFLRDKLSIRFGRLTINSVDGEEFLGSEYFKAFTSVGFNLVPLGPFLNAPGASGYPFGTWGARVKGEPVTWLYVMAGVYNGDPKLKRPAANGVDFSMHGPAFAIGEMGVRWNRKNGTPSLAGNLKIGAYFNGGDFKRFDSGLAGQPPPRTVNGVDGFYVLGDQVIRRWGGAKENRHLGMFGSFNYAPNESVNRVPYFFMTGLVGYGILPGRARDVAAFGIASGTYSNELRNVEEMQAVTNPSLGIQHSETTWEWTYGATIRPGLVLQPDLQCIINPDGNRRIANALAMGVHLVLSF